MNLGKNIVKLIVFVSIKLNSLLSCKFTYSSTILFVIFLLTFTIELNGSKSTCLLNKGVEQSHPKPLQLYYFVDCNYKQLPKLHPEGSIPNRDVMSKVNTTIISKFPFEIALRGRQSPC